MWVCGFRFYFATLAGVLFAFPSRYFCSIGRISYLALDRGRPGFRQDSSCPAVLRYRPTESSPFRVRGFHPLCQAFPKPFRYSEVFLLRPSRADGPTTPIWLLKYLTGEWGSGIRDWGSLFDSSASCLHAQITNNYSIPYSLIPSPLLLVNYLRSQTGLGSFSFARRYSRNLF